MPEELDYKALGQRIKKYRMQKHYTQEKLAELANCAVSSVSHAELGTSQEQLKPRLEKDQILISNIGKIDSEKEEIPKTIPLCNGFCCKSIETGICKKASACLECPMFIPSKQFLNSYMLQLQETKASIAIAKACGYTQMLQKSLKTKESLENIISRLKELEEKKDEKH